MNPEKGYAVSIDDIKLNGQSDIVCVVSVFKSRNAGNENRILNCLTTYFNNDTIKGAICGYKCITIFFENFITQESFITNLTQLLNIPEIKKIIHQAGHRREKGG